MRLFFKPKRGAMTMFISTKFQSYAANLLLVVTALLLSFGSYHSAMAAQNVIKSTNPSIKKPSAHATPVPVKLLDTNELNRITHLSVGKKDQLFPAGKVLNDYLKIELIDKAFFEKKRPLAVDYLSHKNAIKKQDSVISIQLVKDSLKLVDIDSDDDGETYRYIGQIDALDQHLVEVLRWESQNYQMFDQVEGFLTQEFSAYPYLSPNKRYIISAYANPYEGHTDLGLYKVKGREIIPVMSAGFKNWMPITDPADIFWARDGYLYVAVTHSASAMQIGGRVNAQTQYIRIKVDL